MNGRQQGTAVIVANPRKTGGADRRTESMASLLSELDFEVDVLQPRLRPRRIRRREFLSVARGEMVPEALAFDVDAVERQIARRGPDVVILQTARAVHPRLFPRPGRHRAVVVDLVDRLSESYQQRSHQVGGSTGHALRSLARFHQRFETRLRNTRISTLAAGHSDAVALGAVWIPNIVESFMEPNPDDWLTRPHDAVFFGTLSYQPNVEALEVLDRWLADATWRPSILVAGRSPTPEVQRLCANNRWTLIPDFPSVSWLTGQARVAIAPLLSTAGIQNKVLEATCVGLAQVVTPAAVAGLDPSTPLEPVADGPAFVRRLQELSHNADESRRQVTAMQHHLQQNLSVRAVAPRLGRVLDRARGDLDHHPAGAERR